MASLPPLQNLPTSTLQPENEQSISDHIYPPEGEEEREIQLLHSLKSLAYESDVQGTSLEFIELLQERWKWSRGFQLMASLLVNINKAQAYLSLLIHAACQGYISRLQKQVLMVEGNLDMWLRSTLGTLQCLYRNLDHFDPASVVRVYSEIAKRSGDFPEDIAALFLRYQPSFDQFKDCLEFHQVTKVQLRGYLSALLHEIVARLPPEIDKGQLQVDALHVDINDFEVPVQTKCTTTVAEEWKQMAPKTSVFGEQMEAVESQMKGGERLNEDNEESIEDDADACKQYMIRRCVTELCNDVYKVDEHFERKIDGKGLFDVALEFFQSVLLQDLMDPCRLMMKAFKVIASYLAKLFNGISLGSVANQREARFVSRNVLSIIRTLIVVTINHLSSIAAYVANDMSYAVLREVLTNFVEVDTYHINTISGKRAVRGKGYVSLVDDKGGVTKIQLCYSPDDGKPSPDYEGEAADNGCGRGISAVISNSYILQAGYTLDTFIDGNYMRFVNQTGGSIWVYRSLDRSLCMPLQGLLKITLLMEALVKIHNSEDDPIPDITFDSDDDSAKEDVNLSEALRILLSAVLTNRG